jgi:hypothetical protein
MVDDASIEDAVSLGCWNFTTAGIVRSDDCRTTGHSLLQCKFNTIPLLKSFLKSFLKLFLKLFLAIPLTSFNTIPLLLR